MKIAKDKLLAALVEPVRITQSKAGRGVAFLLIGASGGFMEIEANDGDQSCLVRVECDGDLDPTCIQPLRLQAAVAFASESIEIESLDTALAYKSGRRSMRIPKLDSSQFTRMAAQGALLVAPTAEMAKGIRRSKFSAEESSHRYIMKCIRLSGAPTALRIESGNGIDLAYNEAALICSDFDIMVPSAFASSITLALEKPGAEILLAESTVTVKHQFGHYTCKLMEGVYPNMRPIFDQKRREVGMISRDEWVDAFRAVKMVGSDNASVLIDVRLEFSEKECRIVIAGDSDFMQTVDGNFVPQSFRVNGAGFLNCLNGFDEGATIKMSVAEECQATVLEDGDFHLATCQLRN